jgi:tetratricopeptide (TPR) repeat protein
MSQALDPRIQTLLQQAGAAIGRGQLAAAEQPYRQALALAPGDPAIGTALGHVLRQLQRPAEARVQFEAVLAKMPRMAEARHGLGLALQDMMDFAGADAAFRAVLADNPRFLPATLSRATLATRTGRPDEALALLAEIPAPNPRIGALIAQLRGSAHFTKEDNDAALAEFDKSIALGFAPPEAIHSRAIALQRLGRAEEALASLRQATADYPGDLVAHQLLNELLYRLKRDGEFLRSFDQAAAKFPGVPHFALTKAAMLVRTERPAEALALYEQALLQMPGEPVVLQGLAMAHLKLGQTDAAIARYEEGLKVRPDDLNMLTGVAAAYLVASAPKKAEAAALTALQRAPFDQTALCVLGTAWRVLDDPRAEWLYRHDEFIQVLDLEAPPDFANMAEFCGALDRWLDSVHRDAREHIDQSVRGGTQTVGGLFRPGRHPLIEALRLRIEEALNGYIARLPDDGRHPFLARRRDFRFAGSWSSRLKDQGFHTNHIHPMGWISSAFYVALPDAVEDAEKKEGWIKFGEPGYHVGLKEPVSRFVQPKVGRLVLFPSYLWHGTVPFRAAQNRTTIAFDAVPDVPAR